MGLMSLQTNNQMAYYFRTFGILGTFIFMAGVQFTLCYLSVLPNKLKNALNLISLTGIPIFFAYSTPGQTIFVHNSIGTTFYFKPGVINTCYSLYFFVVSVNIFLVTLHTAKNSPYKRIQVAAKRLLIVESLIFVGAVFDMIFPSMGIPAIPGSAITHFWGVSIFWLALHAMYKSELTVANMSEYVYHSLNAPVLIFNPKGELEIINSASIAFFGIDEESFVPGTIGIDKILEAGEDVFNFEGNNCVRTMTSKSNGAHCEISISKIMDSYQDIIGYICLSSDLTEHELAISQLEQAKLVADSANMSKSLFLANMSHEIRTPMNAILGFSEIALSENIDKTARNYFNEIKQAGNVLLTVINDILNISKIELGVKEVSNHNYNLVKIIKDAELITRVNANKKGLALNVNIARDIPEELCGDFNKIREILLNILGNAVKYTNQGKIDFDVSIINHEESTAVNPSEELPCMPVEGSFAEKPNDSKVMSTENASGKIWLRFEVSDTGIGIKEEDIETIFDKFTRVDAKLTSTTEGTGLGLPITKGLVELLGGTIEVKSEYGKGTTFIVEIPQAVVDTKAVHENKSESAEAEETEKPKELIDLQGNSFLVVDDTKINLIVAAKFLKKYGADVDTALSGVESIEKCKTKKYDIVFMDHMMPEMDGVEAMKNIRQIEGYETGAKQKIVALTANAVDSAREMLLSEGFDDFISKPIKSETLDEVITKMLA